jgi:hypothetical protein
MTPQESQILQKFLRQLTQAHVSAKDPEAQSMIGAALAQQPDAAYLLVQRALLLEQALQQAKSQLAQLQTQRDAVGGGNWTGSQAWPSTAGPAPAPVSMPPAPPAAQAATPSAGWGFLGNAASTAAGVAGGAFLFQGLEDLFGHHGGSFLSEAAPTETVENITVNEYPGAAELPGSDTGDSDAALDEDDEDVNDDSSWT